MAWAWHRAQRAAYIEPAAFSAIMIVGALVLPLTLRGMTEGLTAKNPVKSTRKWF